MHVHQPTGDYYVPSFPFSNDEGLADRHGELAAFNQNVPPAAADCAVIVGSGAIASMADVLPATIYVTDRAPELLDWVALSVETLATQDTRAKFIDDLRPPGTPLLNEARIMGPLHFLKSDERYEDAREAMAAKTMAYVVMDYSVAGEADALAAEITANGHTVRLFNATNMHHAIARAYVDDGDEHLQISEYVESLEALPWADEYRIMSSDSTLESSTSSKPLVGSLEDYGDAMVNTNFTVGELMKFVQYRRSARAQRTL